MKQSLIQLLGNLRQEVARGSKPGLIECRLRHLESALRQHRDPLGNTDDILVSRAVFQRLLSETVRVKNIVNGYCSGMESVIAKLRDDVELGDPE